MAWPAQTVSQKSRTGLRLALTEVSRGGTGAVSAATACTPPVVATSVARMARKWKITLRRPIAVTAMIRAATMMVIQAAAGIGCLLTEKFRDGTRVPDRADRDLADRDVGLGQALGHALKLADQLDSPGQELVGGAPDPLQSGEHPVQQADHHGQ